jgi:predicted enzyme related to lactoylglutathione lyase
MGNPFIHIELNTDNLKGSKKFYTKLFKWKLAEMPGPYTMIDTGSKEGGGGMQTKPMPEAPTAWLPYVEVKDVKKTLAQAKKLGAKIALEYQPIPGMGSIGIFIDPAGAALGVWAVEAKKKKSRK